MPRPLVNAEGLHKSHGGRVLLDDAAFFVEPGERVALVGPNGCGKSTLLAMVAGRAEPDHGSLDRQPGLRVSFFDQHPRVEKGATIASVLASAVEPPPHLTAELAALEARMADPALYESPEESNEVLARFGEVQREIAHARAGGDDAALAALVEELGFTEEDRARDVLSLSGGERTRLFLARALAQPCDLLVLDEPTNHLDVETIEWLEERLSTSDQTVLMVAHDRAFLDNVTTRVVAFERGRLASYPGDYSAFERAREEDAARLAARREREEKELERQKGVIEQFRHQKRFDGQMASRLTRLAKTLAAADRTPDPLVEKAQLAVSFPESFKSSQDVVRIRGLAKQYGDRILFYGLDLDVSKGDRLALVGPNGAGKTTLLKMLVGREQKNLGTIEMAPGVKGSYYAQGAENLDVSRTLRHEVLAARPGLEDDDVRALLGRFGFRHEGDAQRKVGTLSGGERARLALLKTILAPSNLLILDEPTNHLDLESRKALVGALNAYKGTLLIVSHDRWLLDSVVDKVAVVARRTAKVFAGTYSEVRAMRAMDAFSNEKPTAYVVRKAFKDYDAGVKHTVGSTIKLTSAELDAKRLWRTALAMGWMAQE